MIALSLLLVAAGVAAGAGAAFVGVHPRPLFTTSGRAAYCSVQATSQDATRAAMFCWRPRDGFALWIAASGRRAESAYFKRSPTIVHGTARLKGYTPRARVLASGTAHLVRCAGDFSTCGRGGRVAFRCVSRDSGVTCTNTLGHGFRLARVRGFTRF